MTSGLALGESREARRARLHARLHAARWRTPPKLALLAFAVAVLVIVPFAFLLLEAVQFGWAALRPLLFRSLTGQLLWNTLSLTVVVTVLCAVIGTLAAWCIERSDLPGARLWSVLVVVPVAIPDFVVAFGWNSIDRSLQGYWAAVLIMTLAVYPLVYLPVAASLRRADPGQEEVAHSLGAGRFETFWRITIGQARLALLGGCVLVALIVLAEYGAFEILGFRSFTTEIYTEFQTGFSTPGASALSIVLLVLGLLFVMGEAATRGQGRMSRVGPLAQRLARRHRLGAAKVPVLLGFFVLVGLALGVPVGAIGYWLFAGGTSTLPAASLGAAFWHSALFSAAAGLVATVLALPVALLSVRHPSALSAWLERSTYLVLAMPGVLIALALTYFSERYANGFLYQSSVMLVVAYAVMFFPLALVAVRTSLAQAPANLEEVGQSLGKSRIAVLVKVTLPLVAPGLAAAFCLVFLEAATELVATLVLHPTGVQTLATQFWVFENATSYSQAAPYAALIIVLAVVPGLVLSRLFDRLPGRLSPR